MKSVTTLSCSAGYGAGGLGRHFEQLVEQARTQGTLEAYYTSAPRAGDTTGRVVSSRATEAVLAYTPIRFSPGWKAYVSAELFDRTVARRVQPTGRHVAFSGLALRTFEALEGAELELVSPTAHVDLLADRYEAATRAHPIEQAWLNERGRQKAVTEYRRADVIQVASDYARDSFLERGVPAEKLIRVNLEVPDRFRPEPRRRDDGTFRVVFVGSLTVTKGVPVLLDAFRRLRGNAELVLVGGWGTRGMRRYVESYVAADNRVRRSVGDPLDALRSADVFVHPSYSDGFGFAPMEALACGVPLVVTEDTGMKEHIEEGVNGWVVPTGDADAILERLEQLRQHPLP